MLTFVVFVLYESRHSISGIFSNREFSTRDCRKVEVKNFSSINIRMVGSCDGKMSLVLVMGKFPYFHIFAC